MKSFGPMYPLSRSQCCTAASIPSATLQCNAIADSCSGSCMILLVSAVPSRSQNMQTAAGPHSIALRGGCVG